MVRGCRIWGWEQKYVSSSEISWALQSLHCMQSEIGCIKHKIHELCSYRSAIFVGGRPKSSSTALVLPVTSVCVCVFLLPVSPFSRDGQVNLGALHRLEAAGVPVVTSLKELFKTNPTPFNEILRSHCSGDKRAVPTAHWIEWFTRWKKCSLRPVTWRLLFQVLNELDLGELSDEIEIYFSSKLGGLYYS